MSTRLRRLAHDYEPLRRSSTDSDDLPELARHDALAAPPWLRRLGPVMARVGPLVRYVTPRRRKRSVLRLLYWSLFAVPYLVAALVLVAATVFPSYTHRPAHYDDLRRRSTQSDVPGRANPRNEKVFIAASIYEAAGALTAGAWGQAVLDLVQLLGPHNVHLSIYENDADALTQQSLDDFEKQVTCNSSIVHEALDLSTLPRVTLPTGETRIKRIAFLAEVRNRALAPLDSSEVRFDRVLYINDVNFDPIDAAQLLLSTNVDASGRANYSAACAVDFINPFKFYDRFATRDLDGYGMGIPFFPWFTSAGSAASREDVMAGTDAVRVRSCWGGMTAFAAEWFQDKARFVGNSSLDSGPASPTLETSPLRFRYDEETFWESSECCLINADLQHRRSGVSMPAESGIYMNPYIRVAYDTTTLSWLSLTRRPERLYSFMHYLLNHAVGLPLYNERQFEEPGQNVTDTVWEYQDPARGLSPAATGEDLKGHYTQVTRNASVGGYCGGWQLLVINEDPSPGEGKWGKIFAPRPPR